MNKAAFLDILNHVSSISEQEVIELEKLASNFPYCQSAHLLLAKAAYDRGSMLSNQRLRRAAACAANRQLLKKLIYTSGMDLVLEPLSTDEQAQTAPEPLPVLEPLEAEPLEIEAYPAAAAAETPQPADVLVAEAQVPPVLAAIETEPLELENQEAPATQESTPEAEFSGPGSQQQVQLSPERPASPGAEELPASEIGALAEGYDIPDLLEEAEITNWKQTLPETEQEEEKKPEALSAAVAEPEQAEDHDDLFAVVMAGPVATTPALFQPQEAAAPMPVLPAEQQDAEENPAALPEVYDVPDLLEEADIHALGQAPAAPSLTETAEADQAAPFPAAAGTEELDDLFAVDFLAPLAANQDPVMAFVSALETGQPAGAAEIVAMESAIPAQEALQPEASGTALQAPETETAGPEPEAEIPTMQPGLAETASAPVLPADSTSTADSDETLAQFDHYLFTPEKEEEPVSASPAANAYQEEIIYKVFDANELGYWMDSSRLGETLLRKNELASAQPYFFRPELMLEYSRHHEMGAYQQPEPSVLTRQLDIIDQFLKLNPKIKSMAHLKIKPETQEDLSLKSTKIRKNLASETFANILVQQGKIKKAIKIYEHLMLKLPEKKDYFASQIEKLQNIT